MNIKEQLLDLKPYQPGKPIEEVKREYGLEKIVKLASNENPYGCSDNAKEAVKNSLDSFAIYPDGYATELREKLAKHLDVEGTQLLFGNGSDDVIHIIAAALLAPGKNTVMAHPSFSQYKHNAIIEGAEVREVELIDGHHDLDGMLAQIDENTEIVWVCSPNNPTGVYVNSEKLHAFLKQVPSHVLVIMDEAYYEFAVDEQDYPDTVSLLNDYPNLLILRTFSKAYGLGGLRVGYAIGNRDFINKIEPVRQPFNSNRVGQLAAAAALDDQDFITAYVEKNKKGLQQFYTFCKENNLAYYPSFGNFILINFEQPGDDVFHYLLERGFIVRSGNALGFPTSVRITVGTEEQNSELIALLTEMLKNQKN
ncbi:histidinol-phosphate transaminase [Fredinandcohnia sp. QZ13]|uniref:histidinol-phosphate transaminase n=1 Tax=Fredinandcohnia sp. QZ13 TaxID=3073144 RepID=UPI0028531D3C|nr:histidinol-phosphate transaminase [Fredinandcohnia sp. QZ13]MDR4888708.1 histidinol-phosphate transaminase [Fredinandcohnia sp. QZ13]